MVHILDMVLGARASLEVSSKEAARSGAFCAGGLVAVLRACRPPSDNGGLMQAHSPLRHRKRLWVHAELKDTQNTAEVMRQKSQDLFMEHHCHLTK